MEFSVFVCGVFTARNTAHNDQIPGYSIDTPIYQDLRIIIPGIMELWDQDHLDHLVPVESIILIIADWLVVWNMFYFTYIGNVIIPIDELIFFRGLQSTNQIKTSTIDP